MAKVDNEPAPKLAARWGKCGGCAKWKGDGPNDARKFACPHFKSAPGSGEAQREQSASVGADQGCWNWERRR